MNTGTYRQKKKNIWKYAICYKSYTIHTEKQIPIPEYQQNTHKASSSIPVKANISVKSGISTK